MRKPTARTALVTHRGCLDGTGCALVFIWAGGKRENIFFKPPSDCRLTPEEAAPFDEVWFADVCPQHLNDCAGGKPWLVFDHHLSNMQKFEKNPLCRFSMTHSGTSLLADELDVYGYCQWGSQNLELGRWVTDYERLVRALEAYDLGRFDYHEGQYLADLAGTLSQEQMLEILETIGVRVFVDTSYRSAVETAQRTRQAFAKKAAETALYTEFKPPGWGYASGTCDAAIAVSPEPWKNAVAEELLKKAELAIILDVSTWQVSFRSKTLDVSSMAKVHGGGGHKRAAGFKIPSHDVLQAILEELFG